MIAIFLTVVLTENYVLCQFLGICPFLGVSKKLNTAVGMSVAVIFVMALATAATYPINKYLLVKNGLEYLQTIVFILVIAALVLQLCSVNGEFRRRGRRFPDCHGSLRGSTRAS